MKIQIVIDRQSLRKLGQALFSRKSLGFLSALVILATASHVFGIGQTAKTIFQPDTLIPSAPMNENFNELFAAVYRIRTDIDNDLYKGDKGDTGDKGVTGPQGDKGDKGDPGQTGETGAQGLKGETGKKGTPGKDGPQGLKALIKTTPNASYCSGKGGVKIEVGIDGDKNNPVDGILQSGEIDNSQTRTLCNGLDGKDGTPGSNGFQGPRGPYGFTRSLFSSSGSSECSAPCTKTATVCVLTRVTVLLGGKCELTKSSNSWSLSAVKSAWYSSNSSIGCSMRCYTFN